MTIECVVEHRGLMPERKHPTDAGADLRLARNAVIGATSSAFGTGVSVAIPEGHFGLVTLRSSMHNQGIAIPNSVGVIDAGYRGEIKVPLVSTDGKEHRISSGTRIAQLIIVPYVAAEYEDVDILPTSDRGAGGFGSTGAN